MQAIRDALDKPAGSITVGDMQSLEILDARLKNISSISGLQYAVNLKTLDLSTNSISDISPLA